MRRLLPFFALALVFAGHPCFAVTPDCGWQQVGTKQCSQDLAFVETDGYTQGTAFSSGNDIQDPSTRNTARNLKAPATNGAGDQDIVVNENNICRYLGNTSAHDYFVPFASTAEWQAFLNHIPPALSAEPCAPLKPDSLGINHCNSTPVPFNWQMGKLGDTQTALFSFQRKSQWHYTVLATQSCNCHTLGVGAGATQVCDTCPYCKVVPNTDTSTTCNANLTWPATAVLTAAGPKPANQTAAWQPGAKPDPNTDCEPTAPDDDTQTCTPVTYSSTKTCPAGTAGTIITTVTHLCPADTDRTTTKNSCVTCTPSTDLGQTTQVCPSGYTGLITLDTRKVCAVSGTQCVCSNLTTTVSDTCVACPRTTTLIGTTVGTCPNGNSRSGRIYSVCGVSAAGQCACHNTTQFDNCVTIITNPGHPGQAGHP